MAKLTTAERKSLPSRDFALAGRRYPIQDSGHGRAALSRVSQFGTPAEKATVRAKVHHRFPSMGNRDASKSVSIGSMLS